MNIQDQLDSLRADTPGCVLTAFGDISSGLILCASAEKQHPREVLDTLCYSAIDCFDLVDEVATPEPCDAKVFGDTAVSFTTHETQLFARTSDTSEDVVCAIMNPAHPFEAAMERVQDAAQQAMEDPS